ncbi:hypothetical protein GF356_08305 [candidate division GN15 bacterium]|nr:hypothetical protein [candidate division GN15 bacterium]
MNRMYAGASIQDLTSSIYGIEFELETKWPQLCGDSATQLAAVSLAWGGMSNGSIVSTHWIQVGYENRSFEDSLGWHYYHKVAYLEMSPNLVGGSRPYRHSVVGFGGDSSEVFPAEGDSLRYKVEFSEIADRWLVLIVSLKNPADTLVIWGDNGAFDPDQLTFVSWMGEITHYESDMVGALQDSCTFANCFYRNKGCSGFTGAEFVEGDRVFSDSLQWGAATHNEYLLRNDIDIWDYNRQTRTR